MGSIPVLKPKEVVSILVRFGFEEVRQRGYHKHFRHPDGRFTTVPFHANRDISPILLRQIAKDINMTIEEFIREAGDKFSSGRSPGERNKCPCVSVCVCG